MVQNVEGVKEIITEMERLSSGEKNKYDGQESHIKKYDNTAFLKVYFSEAMESKVQRKVGPIESWGRCWALVTGASSGFGAALCERLSNEFPADSVIVGIARNKDGLQKTKENVTKSNGAITFIPYCLDLESATEEDYSLMIKTVFDQLKEMEFDRFVIVHNAGSLGNQNYLKDIIDVEEMNKYFSFNITSVISLNGCLLQYLRKLPATKPIHIVNISSLAAIRASKSWGLYCIQKSARDMMMNVLANEESDLNILSYAPGAIETNMLVKARNDSCDTEMRTLMNTMKEEGTLVKMNDSLDKLIRVMKEGNYTSGSHIDYYTEI